MSAHVDPTAVIRSHMVAASAVIREFAVIMPGVRVGSGSDIGPHCYLSDGVEVGTNVRLDAGVRITCPTQLEDNVRIGANTTLADTDDVVLDDSARRIQVQRHATIGAGCTLSPGITIGANSIIRSGSVVTQHVQAMSVVEGHPAQITGYVDVLAPSIAEPVHRNTADIVVRGVRVLELPDIIDMRGNLSAIEFGKDIPFLVRRAFFVYHVPSSKARGAHAHRECHQCLICPHGNVSILVDDGRRRQEIVLNRPSLALHCMPGVWAVQYKYSKDAVLIVLASHEYDANDYIRDYDEYLEWVQKAGSVN